MVPSVSQITHVMVEKIIDTAVSFNVIALNDRDAHYFELVTCISTWLIIVREK